MRFPDPSGLINFSKGKLEVKIYIPHPALQQYVLNISTVNFTLPPGMREAVNPYPPTPFQSLLFYCNDPVSMARSDNTKFEKQPLSVIVGPQYSRVNIKVVNRIKAIRVDFVPGGLYRMLGIPMHELFDNGFDALHLCSADMKSVNEQLQNISDLSEGKVIVETLLLKQVSKLRPLLPFDSALHVMLNNEEHVPIEKIASLSCLSIKQFERKCKERIGMNPKLYTRILKFSKAYRLREAFPKLTWTNIAHTAGYYDQMHMIKDFKIFAGVNPSVIEKELQSTPLRMQKDLYY